MFHLTSTRVHTLACFSEPSYLRTPPSLSEEQQSILRYLSAELIVFFSWWDRTVKLLLILVIRQDIFMRILQTAFYWRSYMFYTELNF